MSDLKIIKLQAFFYTNNDDKDMGDGIAEEYYWGNNRICSNTGWARDLRFPEFRQSLGQIFNVDVPAKRCSEMRYRMVMETADGWDVTVHTYAWYSDGSKKRVGAANFEFGGKNRENVVYFRTC